MNAVNRIVGAYLIAVAAVVVVHSIAEPAYYAPTADAQSSPVWLYIYPFAAVAIALGIGFGFARKRAYDAAGGPDGAGADEWGRLAANAMFYSLIVVGIIFFSNLFYVVSEGFTLLDDDAIGVIWKIAHAIMPPAAGALGVALLRGD